VFEAEVSLVAAPVFVTDKNGKAYRGLTAEDFEVQDGGKRVPIVAFQVVDVEGPAAPAAAPELPVSVQAAAARQFLLLFDLQFSPPAGIIRARAAAARFVRDSLADDDIVAVATIGRDGVKMLTGFTTDRTYVARAITGLGVVRALELAGDPLGLSGEIAAQAAEAGGSGGMSGVADQEIAAQILRQQEAMRLEYQHRLSNVFGSLKSLADTLSPLRGRKQVVLLSGGFEQQALADSSARASPIEADSQSHRNQLGAYALRSELNEMFSAAGVADVVIHTVDLRGIEGPIDVSSPTGRNVGRGEGELGLAAMAENTGGRRVRATNDFAGALREVEAVSRHYYVLAFQPADPAPSPGRARNVKVRVKRDGLTVSHRTAYLIPKTTAPDAASAQLAAAEAIAKGLSGGPLGLRLVTMPYRDREGAATLPAVLQIDGEALAAASRSGPLPLHVYGYALAAGQVLDSLKLETTIDLARAGSTLRRDGVTVLTTFAAAPGPVDLRFFVRAGGSGQTGSIRRPVEVPAFADGQTVLSAAMPTVPATGRIVAPTQTQGRPPLEIPFRVAGEPFLPGAPPMLQPDVRSDLCVFGWPARPVSEAPAQVTAEIARAGQPPVPVRIEGTPKRVADPDGFDRYMVSILPPRAPAGDYVLRLTFREPATGWTAASETNLALRE
jgi:VWFA-related protein